MLNWDFSLIELNLRHTLTPLHPYICEFDYSVLGVGEGLEIIIYILYYILYIL